MTIIFDCETKSELDLKKVGAWVYSQHPSTEVICACWGMANEEETFEWWPGCEDHSVDRLFDLVYAGELVEAHNVSFERGIWEHILTPKFRWPLPLPGQWRDTMAAACYYALPAGLDRLLQATGLGKKNPDGARLITKYSKLHLMSSKDYIPDHEWVSWKDMTPTERKKVPDAKDNGGYFNEDFRAFVDYCRDDVKLERWVSNYLGDLPDRELPFFRLHQKMNRHGLMLDQEGIDAATYIVEQRAADLGEEFAELTGGLRPTQRDQVMKWVASEGVELENMQAEYLEELIAGDELPSGPVRRVLEIRVAINKASTKKLDAMTRQRGREGRAMFQTRYHGTLTGRSTGGGIQPLNLNRGFDGMDSNQLVRDIMYRDAKWLDLLYGNATDAVAKASRYWIQAAEGNRILAGDFSSIEAIVLACLAGEEWKVEAFTQGVKIYEYMADKIYGLPPGTVTKATHPQERQDGKTGELAFGYQGALGAWLKFDNSGRHSDERIIEICQAWRAEHPAIVSFWTGLNDAAIDAYYTGKLVNYREIGFEIVDDWLSMILPNGKRIWYYRPVVKPEHGPWHQPDTRPECENLSCGHTKRQQLSYMSSKDGQWRPERTYGGRLAENATQATAREFLKEALLRVDKAGYNPILDVYDEIICEVPSGWGSTEEFTEIMSACPGDWAEGWPIRVDTWSGPRYRK